MLSDVFEPRSALRGLGAVDLARSCLSAATLADLPAGTVSGERLTVRLSAAAGACKKEGIGEDACNYRP